MTPRQIAAFLHFADREEAIAEARHIVNTGMAFGAKPDALKKHLESLVPE